MRTLVGRVFQVQVCVALLAMVLAFVFFDHKAVKAAFAGWVVAALPALIYARLISRFQGLASPSVQFLAHALGEGLKIVLSIAALALVFFVLKQELSITYFLFTYIACLMSYVIALLFK